MDSQKSPRCILCSSSNVSVKTRVSFSTLALLYKEVLKVDIAACIDGKYSSSEIPFYRCHNCALEFFPPELAGNGNLYEVLDENEWYYGEDKWEFEQAQAAFEKSHTILEIGCGDGHFLGRMKKKYPSKKLLGIELNKDAVAKGKNSGLSVVDESIELFAQNPAHHNAFDAVCYFQVLEHIANPKTFIESSLACLKKGGLLFISVPNPSGFTQFVENDILNMPPHHISRFNKGVIEFLAKHYHLTLKDYREEPIAPYHKEWYRITLIKKFFISTLGKKFHLLEHPHSIVFRSIRKLAHVIDKIIPRFLWRYKKYTGHTFYVVLEKQ